MTEARAINLYYYLVHNHTSRKEINAVLALLKQDHNIDLYALDKRVSKQRRSSPNRFDINSYGTGGSRTLNQTRHMQA
ncbi:hypothetical protein ACFFLZ_05100 [Photobacterium aphoticum]|uniref:Uncharacterized protein n=1 Tax=Photobacterium aphoticum TaxID=754436 RepID=A0A090QHJ1_9GAMM|nr:hypothetical protein [Photobacterium aphoticum]KLV01790.1 hypothetical protein ABT58_05010 [Photobacterium aphoticum]PSU58724.1 hypothetical protein C9I90_05750 [Photobacterium aphoticum]GAL02605.1 hypothetical protein JCM19237_5498 [Photobacterium aphoticum]GHA32484.1 hypothetical protein GCM10007086_02020 [Photobacterium aphoticum]